MNRKAIIFGVKGYKLSVEEKFFFKKVKPWGVMLFSRNIKNFNQLKSLIKEIKKLFNDQKYPILIDQEGGKVCRLNEIVNFEFFSQEFFGKLFNKDKKLFYKVYKIYINAVSNILSGVGININTVPVLDVRRKKAHDIIGSRSFSHNADQVFKLGRICEDLYKNNKIATVMKHMPGHGLSNHDSHLKTPLIKIKRKELIKKDFKPFKHCNSLFGMTAHIIYSSYDSINVATHSRIMVKKIIREHINFKGILISDDICMKSLKYGLEENAIRALRAGCNLILHCNGKMKEMSRLARVIPNIDNFTKKKTSQFYKFLR